jgi:hypothetical protein
MTKKRWYAGFTIFFVVIVLVIVQVQLADANALVQIPTGIIPTVTGTSSGPIVTVRIDLDQPSINVRAGPLTTYEKVGVLLLGQKAVAKGRSAGGDWVMIEYPGAPGGLAWVYAPYVNITPGELKIVEPPPTPTALYTVTIDPTMAAQFVVTSASTRLATFTPPPPLQIPTFAAETASTISGRVPMGLLIIALVAIGLFLGLFSLTQGR